MAMHAGELALLAHVPDTPPDAPRADTARRDGATLARAHRALADAADALDPRRTWPWTWAPAALTDIPMPERVRGAGFRVLDAAERAAARGGLRLGVTHGDPNPDAFRHHPSDPGRDGLIDWAATMGGPLLYDLACYAVMTRDDPLLLDRCLAGYRAHTPGLTAELVHLDTFVRLRWMCSGIWFAARAARGILRGPRPDPDNERGIAEALRGMTERTPW
ncbi:phosphotransferase [Streptomyces sp. NPDC050560]|uniref:phosphotransferase n=1 Tax=Streptomyces sp. NPDC050560 TaxID=3365630 RepID=UPI0037B673B6